MNIVSRKKEIDILKKITSSDKAEFVCVYGRRRVGKTYLIREFYNDQFSFYATGVFSKFKDEQLASFKASLFQYGDNNKKKIKDWFDAFERLKNLLETDKVYRHPVSKKRVVFLDELPWMDTPKSSFKVALERFWNTYASRKNDLVLIVCGSATSWIIKHLLQSRGGFYNRLTQKIHLSNFSLKECEELSRLYKLNLSRQQLLEYYMVFGGVPYYLSLIDSSLSIAQNIDNLIFNPFGTLRDEYQLLFSSLFDGYELHKSIIEIISNHNKGLTKKQILSYLKIEANGSFQRAIEELEQSGFITGINNYKNSVRETIYRVVDQFVLFSVAYQKNHNINSWMNHLNSSEYKTWSGLSFEQVCMNNIDSIKDSLGILGVETKVYSFNSRESKPGAQIDFAIERSDRVINLCECKYSSNEYSISLSDKNNIENKIEVFNKETKNKKNIIVTFITVNGIKNNTYRDVAQKALTIDDLFLR